MAADSTQQDFRVVAGIAVVGAVTVLATLFATGDGSLGCYGCGGLQMADTSRARAVELEARVTAAVLSAVYLTLTAVFIAHVSWWFWRTWSGR